MGHKDSAAFSDGRCLTKPGPVIETTSEIEQMWDLKSAVAYLTPTGLPAY